MSKINNLSFEEATELIRKIPVESWQSISETGPIYTGDSKYSADVGTLSLSLVRKHFGSTVRLEMYGAIQVRERYKKIFEYSGNQVEPIFDEISDKCDSKEPDLNKTLEFLASSGLSNSIVEKINEVIK